jgi:hypothetical protein
MKFLNFDKILPHRDKRLQELKLRVDHGVAVERMTESEGWQVVEALYKEQLEAYKADLLLGCKDWNEYQEKRSKAWAMNLLLQDIQDFVEQGRDAATHIDQIDRS